MVWREWWLARIASTLTPHHESHDALLIYTLSFSTNGSGYPPALVSSLGSVIC